MNGDVPAGATGAHKTPPPYKGKGGCPPPIPQSATQRGGETVSVHELAVLRQRLGEAAWLGLGEQGVPPSDLCWFVEVTKARLRDGIEISGGFLAETRDCRIAYFRFTPADGFQLASAAKPSCAASVSVENQSVELRLAFPEGNVIADARVFLKPDGVGVTGGAWFALWRAACAQRLGVAPEKVGLADVRVLAPTPDDFGARVAARHAGTLLAVDASAVYMVPAQALSVLQPLAWWADGNSVEIMSGGGADRQTLVLAGVPGARTADALGGLVTLLPSESMSQKPVAGSLGRMGVFQVRLPTDSASAPRLLEQTGDAIVVHIEPVRTLLYGTVLGGNVILVSGDGECAALDVRGAGRDRLLGSVKPVGKSQPVEGTEDKWTVALRGDKSRTPLRVVISPAAFDMSGIAIIPFESAGDASVNKAAGDGLLSFTLAWKGTDGDRSECLLATEQVVYGLWEEWEVGRTRHSASKLGFPDLYRKFNADRRHEFLLAMYGEILLLNRALQDGIPMPELIRRLDEQGAVKFGENKELRDETVAKVILLLDTINQMKQRAEVFASMYPYYWVQQEAGWLNDVFGPRLASAQVVQDRKRLVPALRRQIRGVQSELFRSLLQIEAGSRSIEALLGKDEIRKHWSSKVRTILPGAVQAGIALTMMVGGGVAGAAIGTRMLASVIGVQGLGAVLGHFQQDREGAAQIMRAAEVVFPWWQILISTMPVSLYESAQFLDDESLRAMKRDRAVTDALEPAQRAQALQRLRDRLVATVTDNRRKAFREVTQGSGIRVVDLFSDIEQATTVTLKKSVDEFVGDMTLKPREPQ